MSAEREHARHNILNLKRTNFNVLPAACKKIFSKCLQCNFFTSRDVIHVADTRVVPDFIVNKNISIFNIYKKYPENEVSRVARALACHCYNML